LVHFRHGILLLFGRFIARMRNSISSRSGQRQSLSIIVRETAVTARLSVLTGV
jgi:hypothetical protein